MSDYHFRAGTIPLLISIPHMGIEIPESVASTMRPIARGVHDTDWHLDRLYGFAHSLGASVLSARYSRYVIDLNRPPDNADLYPGQNTTGLCPVDTFDLRALYPNGRQPNQDEIARRIAHYWRPYHAQLRTELDRLLALHGRVLLWDAHSIRSVLPRFFEGTLPNLNFGTADGRSCSAAISDALVAVTRTQSTYSSILNGRFKGGYITRHYGDPARNIHGVQLELTQRSYMQEAPPFAYDDHAAALLQPHLRKLIEQALRALDSI
jgi:N-formylglutamate deformylase